MSRSLGGWMISQVVYTRFDYKSNNPYIGPRAEKIRWLHEHSLKMSEMIGRSAFFTSALGPMTIAPNEQSPDGVEISVEGDAQSAWISEKVIMDAEHAARLGIDWLPFFVHDDVCEVARTILRQAIQVYDPARESIWVLKLSKAWSVNVASHSSPMIYCGQLEYYPLVGYKLVQYIDQRDGWRFEVEVE